MIIVVGGIKGGSGKTTVATNLAVMRAADGRDVLLIDADDQETASDFTILRNERIPAGGGLHSIKFTGPGVRTETLRLAGKYDDIIIDTGGRDTTSQRAALSVAHVLLVPFVPRSFDVWTLEKVAPWSGRCARPTRNWPPMPSSTAPMPAGRITRTPPGRFRRRPSCGSWRSPWVRAKRSAMPPRRAWR